MDTARRIGELEDTLKQRDRTILELRQEAEEAEVLIAELREQVEDVHDMAVLWPRARRSDAKSWRCARAERHCAKLSTSRG